MRVAVDLLCSGVVRILSYVCGLFRESLHQIQKTKPIGRKAVQVLTSNGALIPSVVFCAMNSVIDAQTDGPRYVENRSTMRLE